MLASHHVAEVIAEAVPLLNPAQTLDESYQAIVEGAHRCIPGFDQVSIAAAAGQAPQTRASVGDLGARLDAIQYDLHEGSCSAALQGSDDIAASSLREERRWPRYVPQALAAGVCSQMSVRLHPARGAPAGINFYSTDSNHVSPESRSRALLFAIHAAAALGYAHERETLDRALQSRKVIGQAIGILMERFGVDEDSAFAFLVRVSSRQNIKLRAIAQRLIDDRNHRDFTDDRDWAAAEGDRAAERRRSALLREQATQIRLAAHEALVRAEMVRASSVDTARASRDRVERALSLLNPAESGAERFSRREPPPDRG